MYGNYRPRVYVRLESTIGGAEKGCNAEKQELLNRGAVHEYAQPGITTRQSYALLSACAGEFIQIGLSADTIHRRTTMFGRHPDLAAALISTTGRKTAAMCALTTFHGKRAE